LHEQRRSEAKRTALLDRISQRCAIEFTIQTEATSWAGHLAIRGKRRTM